MQGYVTIKEASKLTGKHPDTIRRLWKVAGKVDEGLKAKYTTTGKGGVLLINMKLLELEFEAPQEPTATEQPRVDNQTMPAEQNSIQTVLEGMVEDLKQEIKELKDEHKTERQYMQEKYVESIERLTAQNLNTIKELQTSSNQLLGFLGKGTAVEQQPTEAYEAPTPEPMQTEVKPAQPVHKTKPKNKPAPKKPTKPVSKNKPKSVVKDKQTKPEQTKKKKWWNRG